MCDKFSKQYMQAFEQQLSHYRVELQVSTQSCNTAVKLWQLSMLATRAVWLIIENKPSPLFRDKLLHKVI